jgi:prepilin-type processing-associated H-X9-DG protein
VIAIIAILASMLLPALSKAKGMARKSICTNNLKQIGLSVIFYSGDYNGWTPCNTVGQLPSELINPYLNQKCDIVVAGVSQGYKLPSLYICPSFSGPSDSPFLTQTTVNVFTTNYMPALRVSDTDSAGGGLGWKNSITNIIKPQKIERITEGSIIISEMYYSMIYSTYIACCNAFNINGIDPSTKYAPAWRNHSNFANVLFGDGHVSNLRYGGNFWDSNLIPLK